MQSEVVVKAGDKVRVGDALAYLSAMKMANKLVAESDGEIEAVYVKAGDVVAQGDLILRFVAAHFD